MNQHVALMTVVVTDYDEAIDFFTTKLNFRLLEDTYIPEQNKRWVIVAPQGDSGARLLLAEAANQRQADCVGNQAGGRVFAFLHTDDFWRDFAAYRSAGVRFVKEPKRESYGTVAVFEDICGNRWDLIQPDSD